MQRHFGQLAGTRCAASIRAQIGMMAPTTDVKAATYTYEGGRERMKTRLTAWTTGLLCAIAAAAAGGTFDFVIETTTADQTFTFYVAGASGFDIDWGDGTVSTGLSGTSNRSNTYAAAGRYTNKVSGVATRIAFGETSCTPTLLRDITSKLTDGVTGVNSAANMFKGATGITQFTQADWFDAASVGVTSMANMFQSASAFNQDISTWNVGNVTTMNYMFFGATVFNQPIGNWDVDKVTIMTLMFRDAKAFNQPIGGWSVSNVIAMQSMFQGASAYNQDISSWNVGKVTSMNTMFYSASKFNQPIGDWDVSNVTTMNSMFQGASAFNQPIGDWNVGKVTDMYCMLRSASAFNQDISAWNVSNVTTMAYMLQSTAFKQDISNWNVAKVTTFENFLQSCTLSTDHYNQLLMRWSNLPLKSNVKFHAGSSKYDLGLPAEKRQYIVDTFTWTITDGGTTGNQYKPPVPPGTLIIMR